MDNRWSQLNMKEKAQLLGIYASKGYTDLASIISHYNTFQAGGSIKKESNYSVGRVLDGIYRAVNREEFMGEPSHKYQFIKPEYVGLSEEELDSLVGQADERGHRLDIVKAEAHPSHYSRGAWSGNDFELTDKGLAEVNHTYFGLNDGGQDPQAKLTYKGSTVLPEITITPDGAYIYNTYDNIKLHLKQQGGSLGKVTPYGQWQYPHQVTTIPSNNITMKGVDYPVIGISNTGDTKYMLPNMDYLFDGQYVTEYPISYQKGGKLTRVRRNDSSTQASSESMEDRTARHIQNFKADKINHNYDIPYIEEKEIVVPGVGRVSTNALDSVAKYSYLAGIPLEEGLGLAAQESAFGAIPFLNYNKIPDSLPQEEKDRRAAANRALGNTSYFRNYGSIPANYLVRDWHYFDLTDKQRETTPPLLDAFRYWKASKYNTNDKSHTEDVRTKGRQVIKTAPIQAWMQSSKYIKKATTKKNKRK